MPIKISDMELYDVDELAELLHIQERTVRKLLAEGKLKGRKLARKWYVTEEELQRYFSMPEPQQEASQSL